jgi:hypothetical protein
LFANNRNRIRWAVLGLSQDEHWKDLFENFSVNSLNGDLSNAITFNPPLFSLVNTFKSISFESQSVSCTLGMQMLFLNASYSGCKRKRMQSRKREEYLDPLVSRRGFLNKKTIVLESRTVFFGS